MVLQLVEYWKHIGEGYQPSENTFSFDPMPYSLTKEVKVKWRIRRPGFQRKIERARFRYNEEISFKISGSCSTVKRAELEWYAKRDSLFRLIGCDMVTFHAEQTSDCNCPAYQYWDEAQEQTCNPDSVPNPEPGEQIFVVFENAKFTQREGKEDWFDYSISLKRVHLTRH